MTPKHFPYDILREIMLYTYVYTLDLSSDEADLDLQVLSPPVPASHVCRSWRHALLSDPTMWTCLLIQDMKPDGIMELLRRSDSSLLNVFLKLREQDVVQMKHDGKWDILPSLFEQIHRFRILRMEVAYWPNRSLTASPRDCLHGHASAQAAEQVMSYLQLPAPKLQTFSFYYDHLDIGEEFNPDYMLMSNLFSGDAPDLKRIHHRLSLEFQEVYCPVFHDLSELYLSLIFGTEFRTLIDLLALSPRLKLLHIHIEPSVDDTHIWDMHNPFDGRVSLPCLEKLVLNANYMSELVPMFLEHVSLPSDLKWYIGSMHRSDFEESLPLLQLLSRVRFAYLYINVANVIKFSFEEKPIYNINQSDANGFAYAYEKTQDLLNIWDPLMRVIDSSHITRMSVDLDNALGCGDIFPTIFASMSSLKLLTVRQGDIRISDEDKVNVSCLTALIMALEVVEKIEEYNPNATNLIQISEPVDILVAHNSNSRTSTMPALPCPLLRKLTVRLCSPFEEDHVELLLTCSELRRTGGYPLRILVRCPQIDEGAERILQSRENDDIRVSIIPLQS